MQRRRSRLRPDYRTAIMQRLQQHPASRTSATATTRWSTAAKVSAEEEVAPPRPRWRSAAACNCVGSPTELPKPSPICSNSGPTSSLSSELFCCGGSLVSTAADVSFATANHSFCVMSHDCKEKVKAREQNQAFKNQIPVVKLREIGLEKQRRWRGGRRPESSCSLERERRPPAAGKKEEDEGRRRNLHHCSVPLLPSSDEDYCLGSGSSSCASSDNMVQIRSGTAPGRARRLYTTAETGMKSMDKIAGRKEAITRKLMKKLEDEEASIDAWMKNKTTKAKMEMKQLEKRLEKKQEAGMERMQRKIKVAHNKAEKKKDKERKAATQSISTVSTAFEKMMLTGKAPWRLPFL